MDEVDTTLTCETSVTGVLHLLPAALTVLALLLLLNGIDDLVPLGICLSQWSRLRRWRSKHSQGQQNTSDAVIERPIAIFVPCWNESAVIANMVRHNLAAIRYSNYHFFLGVYPNDTATVEIAGQLEGAYRNVHMAVNERDGPTSKADCLNAIYARMCEWEGQHGVKFNTVVLHDAEDLIDPNALSIINRERCRYAMVQVPVLPLPTPISDITHGVYCDEFSEFQTIDMPARFLCGSFIPSSGVGTGFARHILQRLSCERSAIFNPVSLTEDYELGVYIHKIGHRQLFVPLPSSKRNLVATREFFPRTWRTAIRQRTRWATGISLQGWERDGWQGSLATRYWFWRDRKGLAAHLLSLLANLFTAAALVDIPIAAAMHRPLWFDFHDVLLVRLFWATNLLQWIRMVIRMLCVAPFFGVPFALAMPLRAVFANFINCAASLSALIKFAQAKVQQQPLVWLKTDHHYPSAEFLPAGRRELKEVLLSSGLMTEERLNAFGPLQGNELLTALLAQGLLTEDERCHALSLQSGIPLHPVDVGQVKLSVLRSLPRHVEHTWGILPFSLRNGRLLVASAEVPASTLFEELKQFTSLPVDLHLISRRSYEELRALL